MNDWRRLSLCEAQAEDERSFGAAVCETAAEIVSETIVGLRRGEISLLSDAEALAVAAMAEDASRLARVKAAYSVLCQLALHGAIEGADVDPMADRWVAERLTVMAMRAEGSLRLKAHQAARGTPA